MARRARRHYITTKLRDEHWAEFHALLMDRSSTIDEVADWLISHGYRTSRSSICRYKGYLSAKLAEPDYFRACLEGHDIGRLAKLVVLTTYGPSSAYRGSAMSEASKAG